MIITRGGKQRAERIGGNSRRTCITRQLVQGAQSISSVFAEQLLAVFHKADHNDHRRSHQADKENDFQQPHCKYSQSHASILTQPHALHSPLYGFVVEAVGRRGPVCRPS